MGDKTTIQISKALRAKLEKLGSKGDRYEDIIQRMSFAINASPNPNCVKIKNELFNDPKISYKALGLLGLLLTNQSGKWVNYLPALRKFSKEGSHAIQSGLKELEVAGYISIKNKDLEILDKAL